MEREGTHTSKSLKAALLFNPWTFASRAYESRPCLLFHRVEDEDWRRFEVGAVSSPLGLNDVSQLVFTHGS